MTKNEKLNSLKDLSKLYEQEIDKLLNENETINTTYSSRRNEIILNAGRSEKRFEGSLFRFGASLLVGIFTIGILSGSALSFILFCCLAGAGLADLVFSMVGLRKFNQQAQDLDKINLEKTNKINENNKLIQLYENKKQKASTIISELSKEIYHSKKAPSKSVIATQTTKTDNNEITK